MGVYRRVTPVTRRVGVVGVNGPFDLGVNPISYAVLHIDGLVAGAGAVGQEQPFTDIDRVRVTFNGAGVVDINGEDLRAILVALGWRVPFVVNHASTSNGDLVRMSLPIPFSRRRFWLREAFPASRRGEFQISVTLTTQGSTFQTRNIEIETVEILDAQPMRFLKYVEQARALTSGDPDFELPVGNDYVGVLIFHPVSADAGFGTGTIGRLRLLLDNVEFGIADASFEAARDLFEQKGHPLDNFNNAGIPQLANYAYVDFDPLLDDQYLVPTVGRSSIKFRFEIDNAGSVRVHPIELVAVPGAAPGAVTP